MFEQRLFIQCDNNTPIRAETEPTIVNKKVSFFSRKLGESYVMHSKGHKVVSVTMLYAMKEHFLIRLLVMLLFWCWTCSFLSFGKNNFHV